MGIIEKAMPLLPDSRKQNTDLGAAPEPLAQDNEFLKGNLFSQPNSGRGLKISSSHRPKAPQVPQPPPRPRNPVAEDWEDDIDLREYLAIFMKRKWSVITFALLIPLLAAAVLFSTKSVYRSTATLLIEPENVNLGNIRDIFSNPNNRAYYSTQYQILNSRGLAEQVIEELNLARHPEFLLEPDAAEGDATGLAGGDVDGDGVPVGTEETGVAATLRAWYAAAAAAVTDALRDWTPTDEWLPGLAENEPSGSEASRANDLATTFMKRLAIAPVKDTQMVEVSFEANDPKLAAQVANTLSERYIQFDTQSRRQAKNETSQKLNERLKELYENLKRSEAALQEFRNRERLVDFKGIGTIAGKRLETLSGELLKAKQRTIEAEKLYQQARTFSYNGSADVVLPSTIRNDKLLTELLTQEAELQARRRELDELYTPGHPDMADLRIKIGGVRSSIVNRVQTLTSQLQQDYQVALNNEASLQQQMEQAEAELKEINAKEFQLAELQLEVDNNRNLYDTFANRIKETQATNDIQPDNARIVDYAVVETKPYKPNRRKLLLLSIAVGICMGLGWALLREYLDKTIKKIEDIEDRLQVPVLGFLPRLKKRLMRAKTDLPALYCHNHPTSSFAEAVRSLRTNVTFSCVDAAHKVIVVTSPRPEEGKSSVSMNLAFALAETSKVLLIDADMRRPSVAETLRMDNEANGLSQYAAGLCTQAECVYDVDDTNLSVIPAGVIPPNPLDLLSSRRFDTLLSSLIGDYNYIIIDSPPLLPVSDALVLSQHAHGMILVTRAESTPHRLAQEAVKRLQSSRAPLIGVVLNGVNIKHVFGYEAYGYS